MTTKQRVKLWIRIGFQIAAIALCVFILAVAVGGTVRLLLIGDPTINSLLCPPIGGVLFIVLASVLLKWANEPD